MNVGGWLSKNAFGWSKLSAAEKTAIRDFPVLWGLFELSATGKAANVNSIIATVNGLAPVVNPNSVVFTEALVYYQDRFYQGGYQTKHFHDLRLTNQAWQQHVKPVFEGAVVDGRQRLIALLLIIHRLRNNYLHGEKAVYGFAGQLDNFRHANRSLMTAIPLWP
ncbi:hypothetical protein FJ959_08125 [Mesorhizobium sp. B2-2-4]|uniref:hypothetical protein n=1 Tax=unclassified Mesorhizobium TaxID=325217 RepID=UPI0011286CE4|nr:MULTISPECIES: hypothetical protein [unclassified Mesorhizobium]TPM61245.1 hypothetical protein FJ959_08125 [Mesorhizobium sp. B2-2-4]TPM70675.1 hypothetical protein FJ965_02595 [Mesorhizobium sp. B2-2-1]TPN70528.1 hypothetical protein FJ984_08575 [Mesorhizobium sp. B1-1-3]